MNNDITEAEALKLGEISRIFKRNGYTKAAFARDMDVYPSAVSQLFKRKTVSARLLAAAQEKAKQLLDMEQGGTKCSNQL